MNIHSKRIITLLLSLCIDCYFFDPVHANDKNYHETTESIYTTTDYNQLRSELNTKLNHQKFTIPSTKTLDIIGYQQETPYFCGPTVVKIISQYKKSISLSQFQYAVHMKTTIQNGTNILALRDELNRIFYPHSNHFYIDNTTANLTLEKAFKYSIDQYTPLVLETDTSKLPGYSGYVSSKHFVVGYKYNYYLSDDEYITEVSYWDPFNNGRGSYGSHTLTVSQMNHAMTTNNGQYLMRAE